MKVNPKNLAEFVRKASLNYKTDTVIITYENGKVMSSGLKPPIGQKITKDNDIFVLDDDKPFSLCFMKYKEIMKELKKIDGDIDAEFSDNKLILSNGKIKHTLQLYDGGDHNIPYDVNGKIVATLDMTLAYKKAFIKCDKVGRLSKTFSFHEKNGMLGFFFKHPDTVVTRDADTLFYPLGMALVKNNKGTKFNWILFKAMVYLAGFDSKIELYNEGIVIRSKDGTEKYILFPLEKFQMEPIEEVELMPSYDNVLEVPEQWNYKESVEKVRKNVYKWKDLTKEILTELRVARSILSLSKAEAAKVMHGTFIPCTTWTAYCKDIGSSRQVVNRWLSDAFNDNGQPEQKKQEQKEQKEKKEPQQKEFAEIYMDSVSKVLGKNGEFIDAFHGLTAPNKVQGINGKESIIFVNLRFHDKDWFKPLYDGVICFNGKGCSVYLGEKRDKFIAEFKQHGICMVKAE